MKAVFNENREIRCFCDDVANEDNRSDWIEIINYNSEEHNIKNTIHECCFRFIIDEDGIVTKRTDAEIEALPKTLEQVQERRKMAYPSLGDFADAVYHKENGDDTKMTAWLASCETVKTNNPKPE